MAAIMVVSASGTKLAGHGVGQCRSLGHPNADFVGAKAKLVQFGALGGRVGVNQRRRGCIVAASPPKDDGIRSGEPLTREDLVGYLASGCKPKERWR